LAVVELIAAILFVGSSGLLFSERFRRNRWLVGIAGILALISTYFLTEQIVRSTLRQEVAGNARADAHQYDLNILDSRLLTAVNAARSKEQAAVQQMVEARSAARQAEEASAQARRNAPGTIAYASCDISYAGQGEQRVTEEGNRYMRNGYGVLVRVESDRCSTFTDGGDSDHGRFAGRFENGDRVLGVQSDRNGERIVGEVRNGDLSNRTVLSVHFVPNGRYAGQVGLNGWQGSGVLQYDDGRRVEGQWVDGELSGFGVVWSSSGEVEEAGIFERGLLVTAFTNNR
jgi:hypothetical protein